MKRMTLAAVLLASAFSLAAHAADMQPDTGKPAAEGVKDAQAAAALTREGYANAATIGNLYEVEAANIAWKRSTNEDVKAFAKMLIADHTAANAKLAVLVDQAEGTVPTALDDAHEKMVDALNDADDASFDSVFIAQQLAAHEEALQLHNGYVESGDDDVFKGFAGESVKTVKAHIEHLKTLPAM